MTNSLDLIFGKYEILKYTREIVIKNNIDVLDNYG